MSKDSPEQRRATPGLGRAWQYWRAIEERNAPAAEKFQSVLTVLDNIDGETKTLIAEALEDLRAEEAKRTSPLRKSSEIRESSTEKQLQALNSILDSLKKRNIEEALASFKTLPSQLDRSKILCSLLSSRVSRGRATYKGKAYHVLEPDVASRKGIPSLRLPEAQKVDIIVRLVKIYFELLSRNRSPEI